MIRNQRGFTIIELLISTVVFSLVLLIVTGAIVQFGKLYYKGVTQNRLQETTRNITEDIAQSLQFSGAGAQVRKTTVAGNIQKHCVGSQRYVINKNPGAYSIKREVIAADADCNSAPATQTKELLGSNMRPVDLAVNRIIDSDGIGQDNNPNAFTVIVRLAYGPDDSVFTITSGTITGCKANNLGGQFCALSDLTTTVTKR